MTDIFSHLNILNLKLQGKSSSAFELLRHITIFQKQLTLLTDDLKEKDFTHFEALNELHQSFGGVDDQAAMELCLTFMEKFSSDIDSRFSAIYESCKALNDLLHHPFTVDVRGKWNTVIHEYIPDCDIAKIQMQLIDLQHNSELETKFSNTGLVDFYIKNLPQTTRIPMYGVLQLDY